MKKLTSFLLIILTLILSSCTEVTDTKVRGGYLTEYMHSYFNVFLMTNSDKEFDLYMKDIEEMYKHIHMISDYTQAYEDENVINNLFTINEQINSTNKESLEFEIDNVLYDMLLEANKYQNDTNGYFNVGMGYHIKKWKHLISEFKDGDLSEEDKDILLASTIVEVNNREILKEPFTLKIKDNKYYVTVYNGVLLDFGALAKGYATQKVVEYIVSKDIKIFSLDGGSSAMSYGLNWNKDRNHFNIGLRDPLMTSDIYAYVYNLKDTNVATSGSYEESNYVEYKGFRYHHIISPITKMPANNYLTLTIIGDDAGMLDAYSTAFFSMTTEEINFLVESKNLKINYALYKTNEEIVSNFKYFDQEFKLK